MDSYSSLFKPANEIKAEIEQIKDVLFRFDTDNAELFSQQISEIQDRESILALKKALTDAKSLYNLIRLQGDSESLQHLDFQKLNLLYRETNSHLALLNLKASIEDSNDTSSLINTAIEDVIFKFVKIGENELILADKLKNTLRKTREALAGNFDPQDAKFVLLKDELERLFKKKNLSEVTQDEMNKNIGALNKIHDKVKELNRTNNQLRQKYQGDVKYTRIHKRLQENRFDGKSISDSERKIFAALISVKQQADLQVLNNNQLLDNETYFERMMMPHVIKQFKGEQQINLSAASSRYINNLVVAEYINEFNGNTLW